MKKTSSDDANATVCCYPGRVYFEKWPSSEDNALFVRAKRRKNKGARSKEKRERRRRKDRRKKDRKIRKKRKRAKRERTGPFFSIIR